MADNKQIKPLPLYYPIIPEYLWEEADSLVNYLKYFPFEPPTSCAYCEDRSIYLHSPSSATRRIDSYYCRAAARHLIV